MDGWVRAAGAVLAAAVACGAATVPAPAAQAARLPGESAVPTGPGYGLPDGGAPTPHRTPRARPRVLRHRGRPHLRRRAFRAFSGPVGYRGPINISVKAVSGGAGCSTAQVNVDGYFVAERFRDVSRGSSDRGVRTCEARNGSPEH